MNDITWTPDSMLEVTIKQPDDFLKIRETLTRIGVASRKDKTLYQSCHILHKQGKYFIVHFKELFALDGKNATLSENDIQRRNTIAILLQDWNLIDIVKKEDANNKAPLKFVNRRKWDTKPRLLASIKKANELINYEPIFSFEDGLNQNIEWFEDNWDIIKNLSF